MRIAYFCMESAFSVAPLEALCAAGHDVRLVVRPIGALDTRTQPILRRHRGFDVMMRKLAGHDDRRSNPLAIADDRDIPAYLCGNANTPAMIDLITRDRIELIVVAFFNQLLSPSLFNLPSYGAINFHPSMLPKYRGPAPLFWQFRDADLDGGLTIHRIAAGADTGDVVAVRSLPMSLGQEGEDYLDALANTAGTMVPEAIDAVVRGACRAQQGEPSRAPRPVSVDHQVDKTMAAKRLFHFVRGMGRYYPLVWVEGGQHHRVVQALEWSERRIHSTHVVDDVVVLPTYDGSVTCRVQRPTRVHS
jgi:methionyl-tRNA formyltransferase